MKQTIYPALRYRNGKTAIAWLCETFGFERHAVYEKPDGAIEHAELRLGETIIMVGSMHEQAACFGVRMPDQAGGVTMSLYVVVDDPDAHFEKASATGAKIVRPLTDQPYGSRDYSCLDPEGHLWSFGTYAPSLTKAAT